MNAKRQEHIDHVNELRLRDRTTARVITRAFESRLRALDDRNGRLNGGAIMLEDPRVIAAQLERLAATVRICTLTGGNVEDLAHSLGAQTIALCMAIQRVEEIRIDVGCDGGERAA